jgi:ubiquitin carboxyl-terminal hydrolase 44/49
MNSILQVLSHLQKFRECFLTLDTCETEELLAKTPAPPGVRGVAGGLVSEGGGGTAALSPCPLGRIGKAGCVAPALSAAELVQPKEPRVSTRQQMSLCHELHTLFQVMWSGKWALVSPFAMLHSVWQLIPAFRGYAQQDAQEFLCELLDKVQRELETTGGGGGGGPGPVPPPGGVPHTQKRLIRQVLNVVNSIFHGQLLSQVSGPPGPPLS